MESAESLDVWNRHGRLNRVVLGDYLAQNNAVLPALTDDLEGLRALVGRKQFEVVVLVLS